MVGSWIGAGYQKNQVLISSSKFSTPTPSSGKRRAKEQFKNQSCQYEEAAIKIPKPQGSRASGMLT
jgi:hypothetical protein